MNKASPNNEGEPEIVKNDNNVVTLTETLNPDQILQEIDSQIVDIEQAGDQLKPFIPKLQKTRSEIAKILINNPKNSEVEVQRLWTEFWDTIDALPELGENKNQATIQSTMTENQPKKPEKDEIDTKLENALKDWRKSIKLKGEDSPEAKAAEKIFKDLKDIKMGVIPKKPETKKEAKKGPKKVDASQAKIPVPTPTPEKENEQPNVYAEEILADLDRKKDEEEQREKDEKARKAAIAYISGKEEEDLTPLPPPVIDYEGIDSALGLSSKPPKEEPVPIANKQIENIDVQSDDSSDGLSEIERIFKSKVYKSPLERSFDRAMSASSNLQEVVDIVTQFAEATKNPEIIAGITTSIGKILNMPTKEDKGDGKKIESLLEILSEIAPIAYKKERESSSDKVGRIVHENGNGLPDIEETLPPIDPVIKKRAKKSIVVPEVVEKMGDAAKLAFVETRIKSGDIPTPEQEIEIERIKKAQKTIEKIRDSRLERVAKLGIQGFDAVGKNYNKLPTKYKVAISISLLAATVGFGGAAITAASTGWRVVSTAGLYVTIERALAASYSRSTDGKERSRKRKIIHGLEAMAFATLVSFYGGEAIKNLGGEAIIEKIRSIYSSLGITTDAPKVSGLRLNQEDTVLNKTADAINPEINPNSDAVSIPTEVTELTEAESLANLERMRAIDAAKESATSVSFAHEVSSGDNMYKVLKEYFPEVSNLEGPQQTNLIENILAEIKKNPADYGITSNDVNQLKIGDTIDLEKIQEIIENKQINGKGLVEVAENLSEEAKNRIANYSPSKTIQTPEIPTSGAEAVSGTEIADQRISDTEVEVADSVNSTLHTSDNAQSANATIDTPSRAPINETLEQIQFKTDLGVKETVEATYGSKGIFGIGKNDGMNIWNNIKGESVDSLPKFKHDSIIPNPEQAVPNTYLQQNYIRQKTEKLIGDLIEGVGIQPKEKESIGDFVKRALGKAVSDRINSPKIISTDTLTT